MKIISRRWHGVADYLLIVVLLSLPLALGIAGAARAICYALAFIHLLVTGFSAFPPGAFPVISMKTHEYLEIIAAVFLLVAPWIFGFAAQSSARDSFLVLGGLLLLLVAVTNYDRRESAQPRPPGDRRRWFQRGR